MKIRKAILSIILLLFTITNIYAQEPEWLWAVSAGGTLSDASTFVTTDTMGNVFETGFFWSDSIKFGNTLLDNTSSNSYDAYLTKYDSDGNVLWAKSIGGLNAEKVTGVTTDLFGNVYLTGYSASSIILIDTFTLINAGLNDLFICKYDSFGNLIWIKNIGGTGAEFSNAIVTDVNGYIYISGSFSSSQLVFDSVNIVNYGSFSAFIFKIDFNGNAIWGKSFGGNDQDAINAMSIDSSGNIYVAGFFHSSSITIDSVSINNVGMRDILVAKFDSNGTMQWLNGGGGNDWDEAKAIIVDKNSNVYITGYFWSETMYFDSISLTNHGSMDIFITKYNKSGDILWTKVEGDSIDELANAIICDNDNNFYITGYFHSKRIRFGTTTLVNINSGSRDIFLVKYDSLGNVIWAKREGSSLWDEGISLAINNSNSLHMSGHFQSTSISFGGTTLSNPVTGQSNTFLTKLDNLINLESIDFETSFNIFPNPTTGEFSLNSILNKKINSIEIFNLTGIKIKLKSSSSNDRVYSISSQPGLYFVRCEIDGEFLTKKLIIY